MLVVGCGTSELSAKLAETQPRLLSVDLAEGVIAAQRAKYPDLRWAVADICNCPEIATASFDAAIDKFVKLPQPATKERD